MRFSGLASVLTLGGLCLPVVGHAEQPRPVVINEVLYDAVGTDDGREWIELANAGATVMDLGGWTIERGGATFATVFTFPAGATIVPGSFLLVGESFVVEARFTGALSLQNGGSATDGIRLLNDDGDVVDVLLYDDPNTHQLADETGFTGSSFAPDVPEGHSLGRVPPGVDTNASAADFFDSASPTPGSANALQTSSPTPSFVPSPPLPVGVIVNEALPNPVGDDANGEFIELFNTTDAPVALGGGKLDDADGGSAPYAIPAGTTIAGGAYRAFPRSETGVALNNDGDAARLLGADDVLVHSLTYGKVPREGAAWARKSDGLAEWTLSPTAGAANVFTPLPRGDATDEDEGAAASATGKPRASPKPSRSPHSVPLADVRLLERGTKALTEGIVSAPPGILGTGVFYLAGFSAGSSRGSGLQVYVSQGKPPSLAVGDRVAVEGTVSESEGETRLRSAGSDVRNIGTADAPDPVEVSTGSIGEAREGTLVRVRGEVTKASQNTFTIDDGSGPLRVLVKKTTGWTRPPLTSGQRISVTGIVSQSAETYRVLPRFADDLAFTGRIASAAADRTKPEDAERVSSSTRRTSKVVVETEATESADGAQERADDDVSEATAALEEVPAPAVPQESPKGPLGMPLPAILAWSAAGILGIARLVSRRS